MLQAETGWYSFYVLHHRLKKVRAAIHFHLSDQVARSPLQNPFGSMEFSEALPADVLFEFILYMESELRAEGAVKMVIKHYPQIYQPHQASLIASFLLNRNYLPLAETGSYIEVWKGAAGTGFNYSVRYLQRRAEKEGVTVSQIPPAQAQEAYEFIDRCQRERGHSLSMDFSRLGRSMKIFPESYLFFGAFVREQLIAACLAVRVNARILYDYAHAHDSGFDRLSPVITVITGLHRYCQSEKIHLLDLGTSEADGLPDFGLLYFKRSLGARNTIKFTFEKNL